MNVNYLKAIVIAEKQGLLSKQNAETLVLDEIDNAKIRQAFDIFKQAKSIQMKRITAITLLIFWSIMMTATVYAVLN